MMVLWEKKKVNVKTLGKCLFLDSGTLTPVLKKLESKGFINRERNAADERNLEVTITPAGEKLRDEALFIPENMGSCVRLTSDEAKELYRLLYKVIGNIRED
jgi:DNA-binding MarR family transcriptional regulator